MKIILGRIGTNQTIQYAFDELARCLRQMDDTLFVDRRVYDLAEYEKQTRTDVLWIGLDGSVPASIDDEISIQIENGAGKITGSNERSVLIGVYRALYELGCRWIRPGEEGELIPKKKLSKETLQIHVQEKPSYRHRAICIEGANDYQHVADMIDWIPKVGMNGYFVQFHIPYTFFNRWYSHQKNPLIQGETLSQEDVKHIWNRLEEEIYKRGLMYHAVGHGWTCEPFGVVGGSWDKYEEEVPANIKQYFAEVNGKREIWGVPLNTNLCYSNQVVRDTMTDAMVDYCKEHPQVDYLHFWLADGSNNHCECPACRDTKPADYFVQMLNELDAKLTAAHISTKIVFLVYVDLLWEPERERILNKNRFVLMFAPITRTYTKAFTEDLELMSPDQLAPYVRNQLKMPSSVSENVTRLSRWQEQFDGDSFDFDYHMMWDHLLDPGYYECARILHKDMANLWKIGLNGMVSCQNQRVFYPTGLPMYAMAKGLWDKESRFEVVVDEYFRSAFGEDAEAVSKYMKKLSELFHPPYMRNELPAVDAELAKDFAKIRGVVEEFKEKYICVKKEDSSTWNYLSYHAEMCILLADLLKYRASGEQALADEKADELQRYLWETECKTHTVFDTRNAQERRVFGQYMK